MSKPHPGIEILDKNAAGKAHKATKRAQPPKVSLKGWAKSLLDAIKIGIVPYAHESWELSEHAKRELELTGAYEKNRAHRITALNNRLASLNKKESSLIKMFINALVRHAHEKCILQNKLAVLENMDAVTITRAKELKIMRRILRRKKANNAQVRLPTK